MDDSNKEYLKYLAGGVVAAVLIGTLVFFPLLTMLGKNSDLESERKLKARFYGFEFKPTRVFSSVSQCVKQGHDLRACEQSQSVAIHLAESSETSVGYSSKETCIGNHGQCNETTSNQSMTIWAGKATMGYHRKITSYSPPMVAWQAVQDNLSKAVPLYPSVTKGVVVRADGRQFRLE